MPEEHDGKCRKRRTRRPDREKLTGDGSVPDLVSQFPGLPVRLLDGDDKRIIRDQIPNSVDRHLSSSRFL